MAFLYPKECTLLDSTPGFSVLLESLPSSAICYPTYLSPDQAAIAPPLCLPEGIRLVNTGSQTTVLCCRASISKGTRFGPYRGRVIQPSQIKEGENNEFLWEVSIVKQLNNAVSE